MAAAVCGSAGLWLVLGVVVPVCVEEVAGYELSVNLIMWSISPVLATFFHQMAAKVVCWYHALLVRKRDRAHTIQS